MTCVSYLYDVFLLFHVAPQLFFKVPLGLLLELALLAELGYPPQGFVLQINYCCAKKSFFLCLSHINESFSPINVIKFLVLPVSAA